MLLLLLMSITATVCYAADTVLLSSLDLSSIRSTTGISRANKSCSGAPLSIAGRKFDHGVGSTGGSELRIDLNGNAAGFQAWVGIDDDVQKGIGCDGSVIFKLIADNKTIYESPLMTVGNAAQRIDVSLKGVKTLQVISDMGPDGPYCDHADWCDAQFTGVTGELKTLPFPKEEWTVLTPKPSPKPRINGARVFGVRPGHPVLYRIAATGDRPMIFNASGLPVGLKLDSSTGRISGSIAEKGAYTVTITVRNSLGTASRDLKIMVGDEIALTPPMGWNSAYCLSIGITDKSIRDATDALVASGLADHGYSYVGIDDGWSARRGDPDPKVNIEPRDAQGNILPDGKFPDMKALVDYIHSKGLLAQIYTSPGPTTCMGYEGSYQHEAQDAKQFADRGFDLLKYDFCSYGQIWKGNTREEMIRPYKLMGDLLKQQDRDIVFNLCEYGVQNVWEWGREIGGNSWRTSGDSGSRGWASMMAAAIAQANSGSDKYAGPGHWNDPDYLTFDTLTPNEQYTHMSLWCLLAAPLIYSNDVTTIDFKDQINAFRKGLLTNDEVIEVDQDPLGKQARIMTQDSQTQVWAKDMEDGSKAVGLVNLAQFPAEGKVIARWSDLGIMGPQRVRDLWRQQNLGVFKDEIVREVPCHGCLLLRLWPQGQTVKDAANGKR